MGRHGISRRGFLGVAAGAAASLSLATRGASAGPSSRRAPAVIRSQEDAELEVWGFDEGRLNFAKNAAQVPVFKDKYPDVKVNFRQ
ncbi:MAG: hypothetical protein QOJ59_2253, partial [Thermomicrobiales bacterium]|nr:hypothetical protein [Thermomicrobiales bacterium]